MPACIRQLPLQARVAERPERSWPARDACGLLVCVSADTKELVRITHEQRARARSAARARRTDPTWPGAANSCTVAHLGRRLSRGARPAAVPAASARTGGVAGYHRTPPHVRSRLSKRCTATAAAAARRIATTKPQIHVAA